MRSISPDIALILWPAFAFGVLGLVASSWPTESRTKLYLLCGIAYLIVGVALPLVYAWNYHRAEFGAALVIVIFFNTLFATAVKFGTRRRGP
jgi:uncharacterized membrane protein HdeD (DUF308 family)